MKEKYQDWIESVEWAAGLPECGSPFATDLNSLRDFLQSLADMQGKEPAYAEEILHVNFKEGPKPWVPKEYADWWKQKHLEKVYELAQTIRLGSSKELAAANARIARLEKICSAAYQMAGVVNAPVRFMNALALHDDVNIENLLPVHDHEFTADQPKRPLLRDQPEVFNKLQNALWMACMGNDGALHLHIIELEKLLVGDV